MFTKYLSVYFSFLSVNFFLAIKEENCTKFNKQMVMDIHVYTFILEMELLERLHYLIKGTAQTKKKIMQNECEMINIMESNKQYIKKNNVEASK